MKKTSLVFWLSVSLALSEASGQAPPPPTTIKAPAETVVALPVPDGAPDEIQTLVDELVKEGVTVDFERRIVEVRGVVLLDGMNEGYPIEYLMVTEGGFTHESLCLVRCTPSKLNAAFLALGLEPGKTVEFKKKDPVPPLEKLLSGEEKEFDLVPPKGPIVDLSVRWTDKDGVVRLHPIEDLISYITNSRPIPRRGFVFVGSRFRRVLIGAERTERFMADVEGNVVSLYLSGFGNCLFDQNSAEGAEGYLYDINRDVAPPAGTKVSFVFSAR